MSVSNYKQLRHRGIITVMRRACFGTSALVAWDSIPDRFRDKWIAVHGDPADALKVSAYKMEYKESSAARAWYTARTESDEPIPLEEAERCITNASVLEQIESIVKNRKKERKRRGNAIGDVWSSIGGEYEALREVCGHTLPRSLGSLRNRLTDYRRKGYEALVNKKYGNKAAAKVNEVSGRYLIAMKRSVDPVFSTSDMLVAFNKKVDERLASGDDPRIWRHIQSEATITNYLNSPAIRPYWETAKLGSNAPRTDRNNKTMLPTRRNSLWEGDGTKLNIFYRDECGKLATKMVYVVMDVASEVFLGWHISDSENYEAQYISYRMAVETAGEIPYQIVVDNQGGHRKLAAMGFFDNICRVQTFTKPENGQSKTIESAFGRFQKQFLSKIFGYTGANITAKSGGQINMQLIERNVDKLHDLDGLMQAYAEATSAWNNALHPHFDVSRQEVYNQAVNEELKAYTPAHEVKLFWFDRPKMLKFTPSGIKMEVSGAEYAYEPLTVNGEPDYAFREKYTNQSFNVKYDPTNLTKIKLYQTNSVGELVFVADAHPYLTIHRAIQDQREGERSKIIGANKQVDMSRVQRDIAGTEMEQEYGLDMERKGYIRPKLSGISHEAFELYAERLYKAAGGKAKKTVGAKGLAARHQKAMSNVTADQLQLPIVTREELLLKQ